MRLVWIFLAILVWNGQGFVSRSVAEPLLILPVVAAAVDIGFQLVRFPRLRFPDAGIANGLFLTIILWPTTITLALVSVAVVTVGLRHGARVSSHPIFNPAAAGVLMAAVLFAMPQPWHLGSQPIDTALAAVLGLILWSRAWHTWRIWVPYFALNLGATAVIAELFGGPSAVPLALQVAVLTAETIFFGLFMVTEPRTAPTSRRAMIVFGATVGAAAALMPLAFSEYPLLSALGVLAPYLALFIGNVLTVALPSSRGTRRPVRTPSPRRSIVAAGRPDPEQG